MSVSRHFLYVEDDPTSRIVMEMLLRYSFEDAHLTILEDSRDFPQRLEALTAGLDVIFLDIHMTPYTGFEMLRMIRDSERYKGTTVIALTASVMSEEVDRLKTEGFNGVIAKPLDREAFPKLMERILNGQAVWHIN
jgi:two-component system, cell cycle response regulator DivK